MIEGMDQLDIKHQLNITESWQKALNITADHTIGNNERFNVFIGVTSTTTMTITLPEAARNKNYKADGSPTDIALKIQEKIAPVNAEMEKINLLYE